MMTLMMQSAEFPGDWTRRAGPVDMLKVRPSWSDSMSFEIRFGVQQGCALSLTLCNYIIDWIFGQALQDNPRVQVGDNVHVSDLDYADDNKILISSYSEMQGLLQAVYHHATAVGMRRVYQAALRFERHDLYQ